MSSFSSQENSLLNYGFQKIYEKESPAFQPGLFDMHAQFEYTQQDSESQADNRRKKDQIEKYQLFYHPDKNIFATSSSYTANQYVSVNESMFYYTLKSNYFLQKKALLTSPHIEHLYQTFTAPNSSQLYSIYIENQNWETVAESFKKHEKKQLQFSKNPSILPHIVLSLEYFTTPEVGKNIFQSINELEHIINSPKPDINSEEANPRPPVHYVKTVLRAKKVWQQANKDWLAFLKLLPFEAVKELGSTCTYSHNQKNLASLQDKIKEVEHYIKKYEKHTFKKNERSKRRHQGIETEFLAQHCDEFYSFITEFKNNQANLGGTASSKEAKGIKLSVKDKAVFQEFYQAFFESIKIKIYKFPYAQLKKRLDKKFNSHIFRRVFTHSDYVSTNFFTFITLLSDSAPLTRYWLELAQDAEKNKPFLESYLAKKCYKKSFNNLLLSNFQFQFFEHMYERNIFAHNMVSYFPKQLDNILKTQSLTDKTILHEVFIQQGDNFANYIHALLYLDKAKIHWWGSQELSHKKEVLQDLLQFNPNASIDDMADYQAAYKKLEALFVQTEKQILNDNLSQMPIKKKFGFNKI